MLAIRGDGHYPLASSHPALSEDRRALVHTSLGFLGFPGSPGFFLGFPGTPIPPFAYQSSGRLTIASSTVGVLVITSRYSAVVSDLRVLTVSTYVR